MGATVAVLVPSGLDQTDTQRTKNDMTNKKFWAFPSTARGGLGRRFFSLPQVSLPAVVRVGFSPP
jgi:hypothetical protein